MLSDAIWQAYFAGVILLELFAHIIAFVVFVKNNVFKISLQFAEFFISHYETPPPTAIIEQEIDAVTSNICNLIPIGIYLLKVNNRTTRTSCEICSKLFKWLY